MWDEQRKSLFASALLLTVLVDQVCYTYFKEQYPQFRVLTMYPKFCGDCPGGCYSNQHPLNVLETIGKRPGYSHHYERLPDCPLAESFAAILDAEVNSFCETHMPLLDAKEFLKRCHAELGGYMARTLVQHGRAQSNLVSPARH